MFPEASETVLFNSSFLFVEWETIGNGEPLLLVSLPKQSEEACGLQNALLTGISLVFSLKSFHI